MALSAVILLFSRRASSLELPFQPEIVFSSLDSIFFPDEVLVVWERIRVLAVVPLLRLTVGVCLVLSAMLVAETLYLNGVSLFVKVAGRKPEKQYKWEPLEMESEEGGTVFPVILVQIPMYNEKEVRLLNLYPRKLVSLLSCTPGFSRRRLKILSLVYFLSLSAPSLSSLAFSPLSPHWASLLFLSPLLLLVLSLLTGPLSLLPLTSLAFRPLSWLGGS